MFVLGALLSMVPAWGAPLLDDQNRPPGDNVLHGESFPPLTQDEVDSLINDVRINHGDQAASDLQDAIDCGNLTVVDTSGVTMGRSDASTIGVATGYGSVLLSAICMHEFCHWKRASEPDDGDPPQTADPGDVIPRPTMKIQR